MYPDLKKSSRLKLEIPDLLRNLTAAVAVIFDGQGNVKDANLGFKYLLTHDNTTTEHWNVQESFVQPSFFDLTSVYSEESIPIYQGILNIGDPKTYCRSINASVYRVDNLLLLVGEHDIAELERLSSTVIELNEELSQLQRELVKTNRDLERNERKITKMMLTDPLTGIPNRRHFVQRIQEEIDRHQRYGKPLSIAMGDIDLFKSINDTYGHDIGDEVIKRFAHTIKDNKRSSDFVARIGGEEFIILLPHVSIEQAHLLIDRMRDLFSEEKYTQIEQKITASFGVTTLKEKDNLDCIIKRADKGLYEAKESGRNKVISHP